MRQHHFFQLFQTRLQLGARTGQVQPLKAQHCAAFGGARQAVAHKATMDRRNKSGDDIDGTARLPQTRRSASGPAEKTGAALDIVVMTTIDPIDSADDEPFAAFSEWSEAEDEAAFADL